MTPQPVVMFWTESRGRGRISENSGAPRGLTLVPPVFSTLGTPGFQSRCILPHAKSAKCTFHTCHVVIFDLCRELKFHEPNIRISLGNAKKKNALMILTKVYEAGRAFRAAGGGAVGGARRAGGLGRGRRRLACAGGGPARPRAAIQAVASHTCLLARNAPGWRRRLCGTRPAAKGGARGCAASGLRLPCTDWTMGTERRLTTTLPGWHTHLLHSELVR